MRHVTGLSLAFAFGVLPAVGAAAAPSSCESYLGRTVTPQAFAAAVARVATLRARGKGESRAAYEARKGAALGPPGEALIILKASEGMKYLPYDAQAQKLRIIEYAFHNKAFSPMRALPAAGFAIPDSRSGSYYQAVIEQREEILAPPTASPAIPDAEGRPVGKMRFITQVIFQGVAPFDEDDWVTHLFPAGKGSERQVGELSLTPAEAAALRPHLRLAFVAVPIAPFFVAGRSKYRSMPHVDLMDTVEDYQVLVADLRCGLALDGAGKVLGAYPTK